jgi:hypothetical protein
VAGTRPMVVNEAPYLAMDSSGVKYTTVMLPFL